MWVEIALHMLMGFGYRWLRYVTEILPISWGITSPILGSSTGYVLVNHGERNPREKD
jgi:hypothetical protein